VPKLWLNHGTAGTREFVGDSNAVRRRFRTTAPRTQPKPIKRFFTMLVYPSLTIERRSAA